jgi:hypothetical protein
LITVYVPAGTCDCALVPLPGCARHTDQQSLLRDENVAQRPTRYFNFVHSIEWTKLCGEKRGECGEKRGRVKMHDLVVKTAKKMAKKFNL